MTVVIPQFDPRVTVVNTLSGGVNTTDRALLLSRGTAQARAAQSLETQFSSRIDAALAKYNSAGQSAVVNDLLRQQSDIASRKAQVTQSVDVLRQGLSQFGYLQSAVNYLQDQLDALENGDITAADLAADWDNKMRKINQIVEGASKTVKSGQNYYPINLIDSQSRTSFAAQTLFAPFGSGDNLQIDGTYLGTDYYITDSDGDVWNSDTATVDEDADSTLTQYTSYPDSPTGQSDAESAITLDSFDRTTGEVTFTLSDSTQVTGTVTRGGLGLLDSFLYANFDTGVDPDAIDNARADLTSAEALILNTQADFQDKLATLQSRANVYSSQIAGISTDVADKVRNLQSGPEADVLASQLQYLVAKFNFTLLANRGNNLVQSMILFQDNSLPSTYDTVASGQALAGARVDIKA